MDHVLDRRTFLKAAGVATMGALGATSTARADEAPADSQSWMPSAWDAEADAVIVGYGLAGPICAIELAKQGLTSLLIEKMDRENAGGDVCVCGGYINTTAGDPTGSPLSVDTFIASTLNSVDRSFAEAIVPRINEVPQYLIDNGICEENDGRAVPIIVNGEPRGTALYNAVVKAVESYPDQITVMYETPGLGLVQNTTTKEVYGVKAGSEEDPLFLKARLGVLIATGSYEADREMTNRIHMPGLLFPTTGSPANTGDGLKMLLEAGCKAQNFGKCLEYDAMAVKQPSEEMGVGLNLPTVPNAGSFIFVNRQGKRFMNETASIQHSKMDAIFQYNYFEGDVHSDITNTGYPNVPAFMIFDEAMRVAGPVVDANPPHGWNIHGIYTWSGDNQAEIDKGWIIRADTLEELAEKCSGKDMWGNDLSVDPQGLIKQIEQFNQLCESGEDTELGRAADTMAAIGDGPYYAIEVIPSTLYATGGAAQSINAEAVDWNDRPIPRLYMAGLVGNAFSLKSSANVGAVTWARIAAEQIAQLEPWE